MRAILESGRLVVVAENETEMAELALSERGARGHVFALERGSGSGVALSDLGPRAEACREPINVTSLSADPNIAILGNFAATPFTLDGRRYTSIEAFWQGLKFEAESDRARLAGLDGRSAKAEGGRVRQPAQFDYAGKTIMAGTWEHWQLMERASLAKFAENAEAAAALRATGDRPLVHIVDPDSKTIPGVIMAAIWMRLRDELANGS